MALVGLDPIYRHGDMDWQAMRSQLQTHSEVKTLRSHRQKELPGHFLAAICSEWRLPVPLSPDRAC